MSFFKSINNAFVKCFDFKTRANRAEFWYFYLFTTAVGFVGLQLDIFFQLQLIGIQLANSSDSTFNFSESIKSNMLFKTVEQRPTIGISALIFFETEVGSISM